MSYESLMSDWKKTSATLFVATAFLKLHPPFFQVLDEHWHHPVAVQSQISDLRGTFHPKTP